MLRLECGLHKKAPFNSIIRARSELREAWSTSSQLHGTIRFTHNLKEGSLDRVEYDVR